MKQKKVIKYWLNLFLESSIMDVANYFSNIIIDKSSIFIEFNYLLLYKSIFFVAIMLSS